MIIADQSAHDVDGEPWIRAPRALLHRLARYLDADDTAALPEVFRRDAELLRALADRAD